MKLPLMYECARSSCKKSGAIEDAAKFQMENDRFPLCPECYTDFLLMIAKWFEGKEK